MYSRRSSPVQAALVIQCLAWSGAYAQETITLETIEVGAERILTPTKQAEETVYTGAALTTRGIEIQGAKAAMQVWGAIDLLPGVSAEQPDSRGLGVEQSSVRLRGVRSSLGTLTVEGVPNYGGNPIGPRDSLYDLENMESISVYKGAAPADIGTGVGTRGGAIVLHPKWPGEEAGAALSQRLGGNDFTRTHARLESGRLNASGTRIAGAASYSEADKWRGPGDLGPRINANLALVQPVSEDLELKLWLNHNDQEQHLYRALTYAQVAGAGADLDLDLDFNARRTGNAADDIHYYDYNRGAYLNTDLLSVLTYRPSSDTRFTLKPYYANEDAKILQGTTASGGRVQERNRDIERWGLIAEAGTEFQGISALLGYHYEHTDMEITSENYAITRTGLSYRGYGVLATTGTTHIHSPYAKLAGRLGALNWQAGLKYFQFQDAASDGYTTGGAPDYALVRASDLDREARSHDIWLPSLGLSYDLTPETQLYASYGRGFIRPYSYMPIINTYSSNRARFQAAGVTLNELFAGYDMEESDTLDLGLRFRGERFEIMPTLFFGQYRNLLTSVSDSRVLVNGKPVSYQQNIGEATGYGLELAINAYVSDALTLYLNPTYTRLTYDTDLTYQGTTLDTKGKQVVDTPEWMARAGLIYRIGGFELRPVLRYLGERHGDSRHAESIDAVLLADLTLSYSTERLWPGRTLKASLELTNLFDEDYVAVINASDDSQGGSASYYPGAPFTAMLTLGIEL
ncbi:TonB-dependent receptor [Allochromatium vinosum]|uniref:TonB-dependent receptor n=1 Tax=Allochromatium vinosum (strain ATCC 17899 / DSM 180 / NBRC 103801 / NCIMB 10441 / D) TaxID=572477 RepID=D3RTU5_ALLVD|nr:TonB-dependent receptor [Allochromatium vinosum]ADC62604.1 TonB-dependent receptor [Allochromatium vinosum DSM 180]